MKSHPPPWESTTFTSQALQTDTTSKRAANGTGSGHSETSTNDSLNPFTQEQYEEDNTLPAEDQTYPEVDPFADDQFNYGSQDDSHIPTIIASSGHNSKSRATSQHDGSSQGVSDTSGSRMPDIEFGLSFVATSSGKRHSAKYCSTWGNAEETWDTKGAHLHLGQKQEPAVFL